MENHMQQKIETGNKLVDSLVDGQKTTSPFHISMQLAMGHAKKSCIHFDF